MVLTDPAHGDSALVAVLVAASAGGISGIHVAGLAAGLVATLAICGIPDTTI